MSDQNKHSNDNPPSNISACTPSFQIPEYVLDDLCSRFIINIPEEERQDLIRLFFQIELAHWFYLDFYCAENQQLRTCGIKDFSAQIFRHCPFLQGHAEEVDKRLEDWKSYKKSVPTYGGILLDPELQYCLLVQGFWTKSSWGFPKGKVNEDEAPHDCAVREVFEETGFETSSLINKNEFLENQMHDQLTRLYIIPGVPLATKFQPQTRKEIKSLQWFPVDCLPVHKNDQTPKEQLKMNVNNFFVVIPFIKHLKKWIHNRKTKVQKSKDDQRNFFAQQNQNEFSMYMKLMKDAQEKSNDMKSYKDMFVNKGRGVKSHVDSNAPKSSNPRNYGNVKQKPTRGQFDNSARAKDTRVHPDQIQGLTDQSLSPFSDQKLGHYELNRKNNAGSSYNVQNTKVLQTDQYFVNSQRTKNTRTHPEHYKSPVNVRSQRGEKDYTECGSGISDGQSNRKGDQLRAKHESSGSKRKDHKGHGEQSGAKMSKQQRQTNQSSTQSPRDSGKQLQILNRDGNVSGKPRRNLINQFEEKSPVVQSSSFLASLPKRHPPGKDVFVPVAWRNFKLDVEKIFENLPGSLKSI